MSDYIRIRKVLIDGMLIELNESQYNIMQMQMFKAIWSEREHICSVSKVPLGIEPRSYYFHHILEKRAFEQYALCKWNIIILCLDVHNSYEGNPDNQPFLRELRKFYLTCLEDPAVTFDNDILNLAETHNDHLEAVLGKKLFPLN